MAKGIDCATPLTAATATLFKQDGYDFTCRYLAPYGYSKRLTNQEAQNSSNAGLDILSVFELGGNRALGGKAMGQQDGILAAHLAEAVGQPKHTSCIYFTVDFEPTPDQIPIVVAYIKACSDATPDYLTGVYGCAKVIQACMKAGVCSRFWQTYAWSYGIKVDGIHVYQYSNGPKGVGQTLNGVGVDLDESYGDEGMWNTLPVEEEPTMSKEDGLKIIALLAGGYNAIKGTGAENEFKRLADEVRKVCGIPVE